jgi:hypothetical protein
VSENEGVGVDMIFGGPDAPQPDWRTDDDDEGSDDDDPAPIAPALLEEMLGFDPGEEFADDDDDEGEDDDDDRG